MRTLILSSIAALALTPSLASASSIGFDTDIVQPLATPVKLEIKLSDSLQHRANNLPRELSKRSGARGVRAGFAGNGFYGERDLAELLEEVEEELTEDFAKRDIAISDAAPVTLRVTLEDVKNNRPTFEQLSREPALSFESFGLGGAELNAELVSETGEVVGTMNYRWFETNINTGFPQAAGVWTDANRAISRFSRRAAKTLG